MKYHVVFDGKCNLCTNFAQLLKQFDREGIFGYIPMQDEVALAKFGITPTDCEAGMILIDAQNPQARWQGSEAAEEIASLLPMGNLFVNAYRAIPGIKWIGDRSYEQIRDNRYQWFGERDEPCDCI
ncbi:MAG: DCC1-like thiol-disulfide oxidoreductase family protein [Cyanobacteria bacterium P01_G01_bin.19]